MLSRGCKEALNPGLGGKESIAEPLRGDLQNGQPGECLFFPGRARDSNGSEVRGGRAGGGGCGGSLWGPGRGSLQRKTEAFRDSSKELLCERGKLGGVTRVHTAWRGMKA